jgi:hypothetical protein
VRHSLPWLTTVGVIVLTVVRTAQAVSSLRSLTARQAIQGRGGTIHAGAGVDGLSMGLGLTVSMHWEAPCAS